MSRDGAQNARLQTQLDRALAAPTAGNQRTSLAAAATVYYSVSGAPSYASLIRQSASIWNSRVSNVRLVESYSGASLHYYEGNVSGGSYAYTDGRGNGEIVLDHSQMREYSPLRIVTHETGHAYGLPDHYSGPCSELTSGGGPGPSCTHAYPNSTEVSRVNSLWAYDGFTSMPRAKAVNPAA